MECLLPYLCMLTVPHIMVGLERMLDYRGVGLERFHYIKIILLLRWSYHQSGPITKVVLSSKWSYHQSGPIIKGTSFLRWS